MLDNLRSFGRFLLVPTRGNAAFAFFVSSFITGRALPAIGYAGLGLDPKAALGAELLRMCAAAFVLGLAVASGRHRPWKMSTTRGRLVMLACALAGILLAALR